MYFNINCYILDINEKKIKISISDNAVLLKFQNNINNLYKTKSGSLVTDRKLADCVNDINVFYLNINKKTKFDIIHFDYNNMSELIGVNVNISGESKYYAFNIEDDNNKVIYKTGYSLVCNKIYI